MIRKLLGKQVDRFEAIHRVAMRDVPRDWSAVWVYAECEGSRTSVARFVALDSAPDAKYLEVPTGDFALFTTLNRESEPPWTSMTFVYRRGADGATNFKAEAGYDPVPVEAQYERRLAWKQKYLTS